MDIRTRTRAGCTAQRGVVVLAACIALSGCAYYAPPYAAYDAAPVTGADVGDPYAYSYSYPYPYAYPYAYGAPVYVGPPISLDFGWYDHRGWGHGWGGHHWSDNHWGGRAWHGGHGWGGRGPGAGRRGWGGGGWRGHH